MTIKPTRFAALFCVLLSILVSAGCSGGSSSSPVGLNIDPNSVNGELHLANNSNGAAQNAAIEELAVQFRNAYPNVSLRITHNSELRTPDTLVELLQSDTPPDVLSIHTGNRLQRLVDASLVRDISDIWSANLLSSAMAAATPAVELNQAQWAIPYSNYGWGIYYRKDIFENLNLTEPTTWSEFQSIAETLKSNNITPLTIGTRFQWPAAALFDYLNLRINGYAVHQELTLGNISYTDERIRSVFLAWKDMIDADYFIDGHQNMDWQEAIAPLSNGDAAMYLMGGFIVNRYGEFGNTEDELGYFMFPEITAGLARAEEAPTDAFVISSGTSNLDAARAFLDFAAKPDVQSALNIKYGQLPVHTGSSLSDSIFIQEAHATVSTASAHSQFYDRDTPAAMSAPAMQAFVEFMLDTTKLDTILNQLDTFQDSAY